MNLYQYVSSNPTALVDPSGKDPIGSPYGGFRIIYHPSGAGESGLDLHAAGGRQWVHAHIVDGSGKTFVRIGQNGRPLPGEPALTSTMRTLVERNRSELRGKIGKLRTRLRLFRQHQALQRSIGGKTGRVIGALGIAMSAATFAQASTSDRCDPFLDKALKDSVKFGGRKDFLNCAAYMVAMKKLFDCYGMNDRVTSLSTYFQILNLCSCYP